MTRYGRTAATGALIALATMSCAMFASRPADWSIKAQNSDGVDLLLRVTVSGETTVYPLPDGMDAVVNAGKGSPPSDVSVATLDPISCRPIYVITKTPGPYTSVAVTWGGTIDAGTYDPSDYGDDWGLSHRLPGTDRCSDSDPSATPAPAPSMQVGEWLHGWEMACSTIGDRTSFGVRGEFLDGAVDGCEAHAGTDSAYGLNGSEIVAWNPDGRETRLAVAWRDKRCADSATVSLLPKSDRYELTVISIAGSCHASDLVYSAVLYVTTPIDAKDVVTVLDVAGP